MSRPIYTLNEAEQIVELFEDVLDRAGITVPSDEDDERTENNEARLYGMVYHELLAEVENHLILMLNEDTDAEVIAGKWREAWV